MAKKRPARSAGTRTTDDTGKSRSARRPALAGFVLVVLVVLFSTAEERTFGTVSDEQQMLCTAVSLATAGEIGIARGQRFTVPRPSGDAVMPYGMGQSLAQAPVAGLARPWERAFGARTSQTLFVLLEILLVTAAAAAAGLLARALGASAAGQGVAVLGAALGSPLWAYTSCGFSEPLQAVCLTGAILLAARAASAEATSRRAGLAAVAGLLAGFAVVAKGVNLVLLPFLLAPLVLPGAPEKRKRFETWAAASAGTAASLSLWLAFELVRFGRPLSSYGGFGGFTHPPLDGLWRLLVGPNKGLIYYFPLLALAAAALPRLVRAKENRGTAVAITGTFLCLLAISSAWWAWDGTSGWGPRFLVPALPALAAAAGSAVRDGATKVTKRLAVALTGLGVAVNLLGALEAEAATFHYVSSAGPVRISPEEARNWPEDFRETAAEHGLALDRPLVAALDPAYSPLRLHAFLLWNRLTAPDGATLEDRLKSPPWLGAHPEAIPRLSSGATLITNTTPLARYLLTPFRWPHLFSSFRSPDGEAPGTYHTAFLYAISDQVFRNLDIGQPERALPLARFLHERQPSGFSAALVAESLRGANRREELRAFRDSLPERALAAPVLSIVLALDARDLGQEDFARAHMAAAARRLRSPVLERALNSPMAAWPRSLHEFLVEVADPSRSPAGSSG